MDHQLKTSQASLWSSTEAC